MKRLPPGPRGLEAYGFLGRGSTARAFAFLERTAKKYGPISSFRLFHQRICLIDDAELIKQVLVTEQQRFTRDTGATLLRELLGEGLLTSEEPLHLERRRVLQPAFHRAQVAKYADLMVSESQMMSLRWRDGEVLDMGGEMRRITLSIVGSALFGTNFGDDLPRIADILHGAVRRSARLSLLLVFLERWLARYRSRRPQGRSLFFARERAALQAIMDPILAHRRARPNGDLMSLMLSYARDGETPLTETDIRNETVTIVLAGHETTAMALTWAWHLIATHPAVQSRLYEEIDAVLSDRPAGLDDVPRLAYTSMVFQEALRLYPPALPFGRRPKEDMELGGYFVPKGTSVLVSPYITQRNERYFDQPAEFLPERWKNPPAHKFAYFPFGGGSKMCIGEAFAKLEGVLVLASLLRRWTFQCEGPATISIAPGITLGPDRKVLMRAAVRR
jgi:cytochrome P450